MAELVMGKNTVESKRAALEMFERIQKDFAFSITDRFVIAPEVDMYRYKEDSSVWQQNKDKAFNYQCFFDGEFVCEFTTAEPFDIGYFRVISGIRDLYKTGKIHWNLGLYGKDKLEESALVDANGEKIQGDTEPVKEVKDEDIKPKGEGVEHHIISEVLKRGRKRKKK